MQIGPHQNVEQDRIYIGGTGPGPTGRWGDGFRCRDCKQSWREKEAAPSGCHVALPRSASDKDMEDWYWSLPEGSRPAWSHKGVL